MRGKKGKLREMGGWKWKRGKRKRLDTVIENEWTGVQK